MSLIFNNTEVEKVIYNNVELDKVIYNGVVVFESGDEFILTGTKGDGELTIVATKQTTVTFGNDSFTIPANTTQNIKLTDTGEHDLIVKGDGLISTFSGSDSSFVNRGFIITGIKKWFSKSNKLPRYIFASNNTVQQPLNFDINLPQNITILGTNSILTPPDTFAFSNAIPDANYDFTFYSLDDASYVTFGAKDTFFKNATHDNDFWYINNYILATYGSSASSRRDTFTIPNNVVSVPCSLLDSYTLTGLVFQSPCQIKTIPGYFCSVTTLTTLEIPASVEEIKANAFGKSGANSGLNEITFLAPRTKEIIMGGFFTKSAKAVNVYTDNNISVLNYDWGNFTPTFYKLDRTTQIPKLTTPTITRNDNIVSSNSITGASKYLVQISSGTSTIYTQTETFETTTAPTNINIYDYVPAPTTQTMYYRVIISCYNTNGDYAKSSNATETWSVAV